MRRFRLLRPALFVSIAVAAVALQFLTHTDTDAQSASGFTCAGTGTPAIMIGNVPSPRPGTQIQLFAFPQQSVGDIYLQSLAVAAGQVRPQATGSTAQKVAAVSGNMNDMQTLKENLPALFATFVNIKPDKSHSFTCGGFSQGKWTLLAFEQAVPGSPPPAPTAHPIASSIYVSPSNAMAGFNTGTPVPTALPTAAARTYYYSYAVITHKYTTPVSTPTPKKGAAVAPPTYLPVVAASFMPMSYYSDGYFGAPNTIATPGTEPDAVPADEPDSHAGSKTVKMFKRGYGETPSASGTAPSSPYLDAQHVWVERYGSHIASANNWRLIAMLEAVALVAAVVGLLFVAGQNKFVPYVVQVDKLGMPLAVRVADEASPVDQRVVRAEIASFINNARSVVTDRVVEKADLDSVYATVASGSAARGYIDAYYPTHSPFERAQSTTVSVSIIAILPVSQSTYEVQWSETTRDLTGKVTGSEEWDGSVGIAVTPPTDEATILRNPLGVYVTSLSWVRKI